MMRHNENQTTKTITVTPGAEVTCDLPKTGVLRFERSGQAMSGQPVMSVEDGMIALCYADGASITIKS
jgi:hypothetical protein